MNAGSEQSGEAIVALCRELGFAAAGVCEARASDFGDELRAWLDEGRHGSMRWLAERVEARLDPCALVEGAQSIIVVADLYQARDGGGGEEPAEPGRGRVARYARGQDYHRVITRRLHSLADSLRERHPAETFRTCVDIAPLLEREHAQRAGLGWIGRHTLLIHPTLGSYLLLGAIVTTLRIDPPAAQRAVEDHCGTCTRCIDTCPTGAITPYSVDASRCISELTIERREDVPRELRSGIGDWLFGCDVCQEVCPHNSERADPARGNEAYASRRSSFDLLEVLGWSADDRSAALAASSMKRATLAMLKRNAIIVAANQLARGGRLPALRARLEAIANDPCEDGLVRRAARDAVGGTD